jgi:hypothetical protein
VLNVTSRTGARAADLEGPAHAEGNRAAAMAVGAAQQFEVGREDIDPLHRIGDDGPDPEEVVAQETVVLGQAFGRVDLARRYEGDSRGRPKLQPAMNPLPRQQPAREWVARTISWRLAQATGDSEAPTLLPQSARPSGSARIQRMRVRASPSSGPHSIHTPE